MILVRIAIDAPPVRSLSANEKMVYHLLKEGKTPKEIAKKMHLALGSVNDLKYNTHDVMPDTIVNLITSIRQKGWDIPTNNKEEAEMQKLTEENKRSIVTANSAGATVTSLAKKYNVSKSAIYNVIKDFNNRGETALSGETEVDTEKEPATAATVTGSEQEICNDIPAPIVTPSEENVKSQYNYSPFAAKAIWNEINALREEAAALEERETQIEEIISDNKDWLRCTDEQLMFVEAQIDSLLADYEAVTGGATV